MKLEARIAIGIAAAIGVAAIAFSVVGPFVSDCTTRRFSSVASPSGKRVAELYQTVCKSDGVPKTEIHLIQDGARFRTEIGQSSTSKVDLIWRDEHSLVISVPPGMDNALDRPMQGVNLEFRIVDDAAHLTPDKTMEPTR
jgi:hypothetical protein